MTLPTPQTHRASDRASRPAAARPTRLAASLAASCALALLAATNVSPACAAEDGITAAQPTLPTKALTITGKDGRTHEFSIEIASTPREQQVGEMFRQSIPANGGMLFVWPQLQRAQMWMENCPIPEDMVFIAPNGTIDSIAENTVPESLAVIESDGPAAATLELQGGITAKLGIAVGDKVTSKALPAG